MNRFITPLAAAALAIGGASAAQADHFYAASTGHVLAYFAGSTAGFDEDLGLLINGVDTGIYGLQDHSSSYGDMLDFGEAQAGDELTFFIRVANGPYTWYSNPDLNSDSFDHIRHQDFAGDSSIPAGTLVMFEDLPGGGDQNFQDEKFVFTNVHAVVGGVPEPASWAMMVGGFGLIGGAMRSRKTAPVRA